VLLEEYESARRRGAEILAEIVGFSCNNNGGDMILPNLDGITATLRLALQDAALPAEAVDFVSAHATATKMGDVIEAQAIAAVYGDRPHVSGMKSYLGHTMGTCGAIELILAIYMMEQGFLAPTLNLDNVDERCRMLRHTPAVIDSDAAIAAIQNFAFGGVNTCLLVKSGKRV
jgi:3-oxoacyl-[acyl-carrier-protein] synthase II